MALTATTLYRSAIFGANSQFHYVTNDTLATVAAANYFGPAAKDNNIRKGDIIIVSGDLDGTEACQVYMVDAVDQDAETNTVVAAA